MADTAFVRLPPAVEVMTTPKISVWLVLASSSAPSVAEVYSATSGAQEALTSAVTLPFTATQPYSPDAIPAPSATAMV